VVSDTHGRVGACRRAVAALVALDCDAIVHLGDVGTMAVLEELVTDVPAHVVFGNCDDEIELSRDARCLGLHVHHPLGRLEVAGRSVAFTHGHLPGAVEDAVGRDDLLLVGHTHRIADDHRRGTRVVNPGALFRAGRYTCCRLEGTDLRVSWIDVGRDEA
jgi:putative phosphoesterase